MPQPEGKALTISTYLTGLAVAMIPGFQGFIGDRIFRPFPMNARRGKYWIWKDHDSFNRPEGKELANAEPPPIGGFGLPTEAEVKARKWGLATNWTDEDLADADVGPMGAAGYERRKVRYVTYQAMLRRELDMAGLIRNTAWSTVLSGTADGATSGSNAGAAGNVTGTFRQWNDDAAEPIKLLRKIATDMEFRVGVRPNFMVIPQDALDVLFEHPTFLDRVMGGANTDRPATVNLALLQNMLQIDEIIVTGKVYNTAKEGEAAVNARIWGRDIFIGYKPPEGEVDPENPAAGYIFNWIGTDNARPSPFQIAANPQGIFINRFTTQRPAAYWAESYLFSSPRIVSTFHGVLLKDAVIERAPL